MQKCICFGNGALHKRFFSSLTEFPVSLTFNHKQIIDWKPTFFFLFLFFISFFFSSGQLQQFWYRSFCYWCDSGNGIYSWWCLKSDFEINDGEKKREKKLKIIHWFIIVATYRQ